MPKTLMLDAIADRLEEKGLWKEAYDLDVISNTLEKEAYSIANDPKVRAMNDSKTKIQMGRYDLARGYLVNQIPAFSNFISLHVDTNPKVCESYEKFLEAAMIMEGILQQSGKKVQPPAKVMALNANRTMGNVSQIPKSIGAAETNAEQVIKTSKSDIGQMVQAVQTALDESYKALSAVIPSLNLQ